ncbi:MAG TPA: alpha/beta hydrolase, partial [Cytophagales bacterium]|nr:alpha/beta hydrolase [Cytophagales bacterium]
TIYSFDLFFHGQSYWAHKDLPLTKTVLQHVIQVFLDYFQIQGFSIITYSLGGKFGLSIAEAFTHRIDTLIMIASDGFVISPWYKLATAYAPTRHMLKYFVFKPDLYFSITRYLNKLHLIPNATIRFAELNMATMGLRRKVYLAWVVFRKLQVDIPALCAALNQHGIKVEFYFGSRDTLIPMEKIKKASKSLTRRKIVVLDCSHSKVLQEYAKLSPTA